MCPAGGICTRFCINGCNLQQAQRPPPTFQDLSNERRTSSHLLAENEQMRAKIRRLEAMLAGQRAGAKARSHKAVRAAIAGLLDQRAELRGDVAALWQRLGDVIALFDGKEMLSAEQQDKLRRARALHALWREVPDTNNGG